MDQIEYDAWKRKIILFLSAQTISLFGSSLVQYAIVWYITLTTSSGVMMTIATVCGFLPQVLISIFAGVWIDRYNRKKMIMIADSIIAASTLCIALLFISGWTSVWMLFALLIIRSACTGLQTPAVNALIPQIVPKEHLMRVNGIYSSISAFTLFLSPAVSAAVLSFVGIEGTFFIDVFTAIVGVGLLAFISVPVLQFRGQHSNVSQMKEGFAYLCKHRFVKRLLLFQIVMMVLISPSAFLTPLMVSRRFGAAVWRLTASEMTFSLGAALGGVLIASWGGFKNRMHTTLAAGILYGLLMIGLGASPYFLLYLVCNLLIGMSAPCYSAPITVQLQESVDPAMHGRVFSFMQIAQSCAMPLGMLFFGPLADLVDVQLLLILCGSIVFLGNVYIRFSKRNILQ